MYKLISYAVFFFALSSGVTHAQMMGMVAATGTPAIATTTPQEAMDGKIIWDKLQNKEVACANLTDDNFDVLADFFMQSMMGANHEAMNTMMVERLGVDGEKQLHVALGKRLSGCDNTAKLPSGSEYFMPLMGMHGDDTNIGNSRESDHDGWNDTNKKDNMNGEFHRSHEPGEIAVQGLILLIAVLGGVFYWRKTKKNKVADPTNISK